VVVVLLHLSLLMVWTVAVATATTAGIVNNQLKAAAEETAGAVTAMATATVMATATSTTIN
jgi:hypothetical protein